MKAAVYVLQSLYEVPVLIILNISSVRSIVKLQIMNYNRDGKGRFSKGKRFAITSAVVFGFLVMIMHPFTMGFLDAAIPNNVVEASNEIGAEALAKTMYGKSIEELKDGVVDQLVKCESGGAEGLIVHDDNKAGTLARKDKVSIGVLQFKVSTVQHYMKTLYGVSISDKEAILLALDTEAAKKLAKDVIFKVKGGLFNWTCYTPEMKVEVELIKKMEI